MANGKAAMELMGQWRPGTRKRWLRTKTGLGDDLGFFPFPAWKAARASRRTCSAAAMDSLQRKSP